MVNGRPVETAMACSATSPPPSTPLAKETMGRKTAKTGSYCLTDRLKSAFGDLFANKGIEMVA